MSLTKSSPSYAMHMDELFMEHREELEEAERIALLERENRYLETQINANGAAFNGPNNVPAKNNDNGNNV